MNLGLQEYIKAWLQKAEHDLMSEQRLIEIEPMILDNACFHCQQAIEKSLKAFLCYNLKNIEKTHDIDYLLSECSSFDDVFSTIDTLNINVYAVLGRYPDTNLMPDKEEPAKFYKIALQINSMVKERIVFKY